MGRDQFVRKSREREIDRLTLHEKNGVVFFTFPILDQFDFLVSGFSTRLGGVSAGHLDSMNLSLPREVTKGETPSRELSVSLRSSLRQEGPPETEIRKAEKRFLENHRRFSEAVGYRMENTVFSDQTHTDTVIEVTEQDRGNGLLRRNAFRDVDGMMTDRPDVALMTFYADCVPLFLADPVHRAVASVHSGWRGTVKDIGGKAVRQMQERYGSDVRQLWAAIGPSICQDCYEVSTDVGDRFREAYPEEAWGRILRPGREGHEMLNLWEACRYNFLRAGLLYDHVSVPDICTCCNRELMFSHRGLKGYRGCLGGVIMLKE